MKLEERARRASSEVRDVVERRAPTRAEDVDRFRRRARTGGMARVAARAVVAASMALAVVVTAVVFRNGSPSSVVIGPRPAPAVHTSQPEPTNTPRHGPPPPPIHIGLLPSQGVAVAVKGGVLFLDLDGRPLQRLRGVTMFGSSVLGPLVLHGRGAYFVLRPSRGLLAPLQSRADAYDVLGDDPEPEGLPAPRWRGKAATGHWRWALLAPDGSRILAQWSGECEVPSAFFVSPSGADPITVTGDTFGHEPESVALGWTSNSEAVVLLPQGACGSSFTKPGVYVISAPGHGHLLRAVGGFGAGMWGASGRILRRVG